MRPRAASRTATSTPATATCRASCAARAASSRPAPSSSPRPSRAACATTPACTARTRSRSSPPASRATRRRHAWAELVRAAGGGALVGTGFSGARDWDALAPYAARIADLDRADVIVVSGERELGDAAGVLELRVRQAVRRGARLLLAGSGGGDLDHIAAGRIAAGDVAETLRAGSHAVLIATDPGRGRQRRPPRPTRQASPAGPAACSPCRRARTSAACYALGYRDDPEDVLRRAEDGTLQMLVVLGDADALSRFPEPERWEAAVQRCESVVASSLFPTPTALWAHVVLPATSPLEKDGTIDEPRGPHAAPAAARAAAAPAWRRELAGPGGCRPAPRAGARREPRRAHSRGSRPTAPAVRGPDLETHRPAGAARRRPAGRGRRAAAASRGAARARPERRRPLRRRAPPALLRARGGAHRAARVPAQRRDRDRARRRRAARHRRGRAPSPCGTPAGRRPAPPGSRARSRPARSASPGTARRSTAPRPSREATDA